ncbi:MAG: DUF5662 family protein [Acholeplasmataceae bacterium]
MARKPNLNSWPRAIVLYLWYIARHKWFVFLECCRLGIPWRGLTHDLSKLRPSEFWAYCRWFYRGSDNGAAFNVAWLLHQRRNPHHWQYWMLLNDEPDKRWVLHGPRGDLPPFRIADNSGTVLDVAEPEFDPGPSNAGQAEWEHAMRIVRQLNRGASALLPMPRRYVLEMVADWVGAGRAITGKRDAAGWYAAHREHIHLHPETRRLVEMLLKEVG